MTSSKDKTGYWYNVHPAQGGHPSVISIALAPDRSLFEDAGRIFAELRARGLGPDDHLMIHQDVGSGWCELFAGTEHAVVAVAPLEGNTEREAVAAVRDRWHEYAMDRGAVMRSSVETVGMTIAKGPEFAKKHLGLTRPGIDAGPSSRWEETLRNFAERAAPRAPEEPDHEPDR